MSQKTYHKYDPLGQNSIHRMVDKIHSMFSRFSSKETIKFLSSFTVASVLIFSTVYSPLLSVPARADTPNANVSVNKQYSVDGGLTWAESVTAVAGQTVSVRLNYDNKDSFAIKDASVSDIAPAGFTILADTFKNCLIPTAPELTCSNIFTAQGGIVSGQVVKISPVAGLYDAASNSTKGGTSTASTQGILEIGKKRYLNDVACTSDDDQYRPTRIHGALTVPGGTTGTGNAATNTKTTIGPVNSAQSAADCVLLFGGAFSQGKDYYEFSRADILNKRYINDTACSSNDGAYWSGRLISQTNPDLMPDGYANVASNRLQESLDTVFYRTNPDDCDGFFGAAFNTGIDYIEYTRADILGKRYLNDVACNYLTGDVTKDRIINRLHPGLESDPLSTTKSSVNPSGLFRGNAATNTKQSTVTFQTGCPIITRAPSATETPKYKDYLEYTRVDFLDNARGKGYIEYKMMAPTTPGVYTDVAKTAGVQTVASGYIAEDTTLNSITVTDPQPKITKAEADALVWKCLPDPQTIGMALSSCSADLPAGKYLPDDFKLGVGTGVGGICLTNAGKAICSNVPTTGGVAGSNPVNYTSPLLTVATPSPSAGTANLVATPLPPTTITATNLTAGTCTPATVTAGTVSTCEYPLTGDANNNYALPASPVTATAPGSTASPACTITGNGTATAKLTCASVPTTGVTPGAVTVPTSLGATPTAPLTVNSDDVDGDGLTTAQETAAGTDPTKKDTDGDGIDDNIELGKTVTGTPITGANPTDPTKPDTDGDGLNDGVEDANKNGILDATETNPNKADTDSDGLSDGLEKGLTPTGTPITGANPTDPLKADTDGDGLADGVEDANKNGIKDPTETDPAKADTDGDGLSDAKEAQLGTDPTKADTDGDGVNDGAEITAGTNPLKPMLTAAQAAAMTWSCIPNPQVRGQPVTCSTDKVPANTEMPVDFKLGVNTTPGGTCVATGTNAICSSVPTENVVGTAKPVQYAATALPKANTASTLDLIASPTDDTDGDGLNNGQEQLLGTDPTKADTDGDGLNDKAEVNPPAGVPKTDPLLADTDGDGVKDGAEINSPTPTDPTKKDTDGDGLSDGVEKGMNPDGTPITGATLTDPTKADTDTDGVNDGVEDTNKNGIKDPTETSPKLSDTDTDGLSDGVEKGMNPDGTPIASANPTDPLKTDTDGDTLSDSAEDANKNGKLDAGETDPTKTDTDGDGITDDKEITLGTDPTKADTDGDGLNDDFEIAKGTDPKKADTDGDGLNDGVEDANKNGIVDPTETDPTKADTDGDGLNDGVEDANKNGIVDPTETDPTKADTDSDGLKDGAEVNPPAGSPKTNPLQGDTDNDGLGDGVEVNTSKTDPTKGDTDGDGLSDGAEVAPIACLALNCVPAVPSNPLKPDTDGDGLTDYEELMIGTNPTKADTDGDGITDDKDDQDADGLPNKQELTLGTNPTKADTDGDGLLDGFEVNKSKTDPKVADSDSTATKPNEANNTKSDANEDLDGDGLTNKQEQDLGTDPLKVDTDGDGISDKDEVDNGSDPVDPAKKPVDTDNDGLSDAKEKELGTDPLKPDTDGDGLKDGFEVNSTKTDPKVPDSDSKATPNKDEFGNAISDANEDLDGDGLTNKQEQDLGTNPLIADTDNDGITDGDEVNVTKTDPKNPDSDSTGTPNNESNSGKNDGDKDLDGDGVSNKDEIKAGSNPLDNSSRPVANKVPVIKIKDPYVCGGDIYGNVTADRPVKITVTLTMDGQVSPMYVFTVDPDSNGDYRIKIDYSKVTAGMYTVNYSATDNKGLTVTGIPYKADIKSGGECNPATATAVVAKPTTVSTVRTGGEQSIGLLSTLFVGLVISISLYSINKLQKDEYEE
jgi:Bacterial TSP3 repeat